MRLLSTLFTTTALCAATSVSAQSTLDILTDDVVVTATKSQNIETVQDVAISVTAFNDDTLDALNVRDLQDLSFSAPNVVLEDIGTSRGTANFAIRGLGVNSSIPSIDPTVGVFVDGVYIGVNNGVVFDTFDVESVELLRGPQGILFGRNTTGGAVLLNTKNPTDETQVHFRTAVESALDDDRGGNNYYVMGSVTGPISDMINGKIAAYYNEDDGYFENGLTGADFGEAETVIVRGALDFKLADNFNILVKGETFSSEGDGPAATNRGIFERDSFDFSIDNEGFYDTEVDLVTVRADWDVGFGGGTITNIFGYRDYEGATSGDIDASPVFIFHSDTDLKQDQISNELRYAGTFGQFDLTTGVYYFDQQVEYDERRFLFGGAVNFFGGGRQDHEVYGAFANVDYNLSEQLILSGGLRYTREEKDAEVAFIIPGAPCSVIDGTCTFSGTQGFTDSDSWENLTPRIGAQYFFQPDLQAYASYTRGVRSGGYNFRITDPALFFEQLAITGQAAFDEETVDSFEIGSKFTSDDRRFNVNGAVYFTDISDLQREVNLADPGAGVSQFILNTADASIYGGEIEGRFSVTENILLTGNVGLIEAEYDTVNFDLNGDGFVTEADEDLELPRVPEATYGFGIVFDYDLEGIGGFTARGNFQHRDRTAYTDNNLGFIQAIDRLDANLTWRTPVEGVSLSVYGQNLLDEVQAGGDTQLPFPGPLSTGQVVPFADQPTAGTFSPLAKGRLFGIELDITY